MSCTKLDLNNGLPLRWFDLWLPHISYPFNSCHIVLSGPDQVNDVYDAFCLFFKYLYLEDNIMLIYEINTTLCTTYRTVVQVRVN